MDSIIEQFLDFIELLIDILRGVVFILFYFFIMLPCLVAYRMLGGDRR